MGVSYCKIIQYLKAGFSFRLKQGCKPIYNCASQMVFNKLFSPISLRN